MTKTIFVYCPCSGDRVFARAPNPEIGAVKWAGGSRHVVGGVHLVWSASNPPDDVGCGRDRPSWRSDGRAVLAVLVQGVGGIAWDEQGALHAIVPRRAAWVAACVVARLDTPGRSPAPESGIGVALVAAGCARYATRVLSPGTRACYSVEALRGASVELDLEEIRWDLDPSPVGEPTWEVIGASPDEDAEEEEEDTRQCRVYWPCGAEVSAPYSWGPPRDAQGQPLRKMAELYADDPPRGESKAVVVPGAPPPEVEIVRKKI